MIKIIFFLFLSLIVKLASSQAIDTVPPTIELKKIIIINSNGDSLIYRDSENFPKEIKIKNGTKIQFEFIGKVNVKPQKVLYKTRLKGKGKDWSPVTRNNFLIYENLKEGNYSLRIHACNSSLIWTKNAFVFEFKIVILQ